MLKRLVILTIVLLIIILGYNYVYQDHKNIDESSSDYALTSDELIAEFKNYPDDSTLKYLDKVLQISGIITEFTSEYIVLNKGVSCYFLSTTPENININDDVLVKGRCIGYDSLLEEVKIDQSTIINTNN
jgi:hypothetical protein